MKIAPSMKMIMSLCKQDMFAYSINAVKFDLSVFSGSSFFSNTAYTVIFAFTTVSFVTKTIQRQRELNA